jgi:hypothetical protein
MRRRYKGILFGGVFALSLASALLVAGRQVDAADHLDPPARTDPAVDLTPDKAADITDVYAWHTDTSLIIAMNFAGPQATNLPGAYDRDVLYTINISNDATPTTSEFPIEIRFGQDGTSTGVQIKGVPGTTGPIVGPVETDLQKDGVLAHAGLLDDPFFFDLQGFRATKSTGKLSFDNTRNFFAGQNLTSVVLQIPRAAVENGANPIRIWATSARFGGQL